MFSHSRRGRRGFPHSPIWCVFLTALVSVMIISGCEESTSSDEDNDAEAAQQLIDQGFQLLAVALESDAPDFDSPKALFEQAKALDPNNMDANVGLVLCEVGQLSQNQDVLTAVGDTFPLGLFAKIAGSEPVGFRRVLGGGVTQAGSQVLSPGGWLTWMQGRLGKVVQDQPINLSPLQDVTESVIIPVLDVVILLLESIEAHTDWQLVLTPQLTGMQEGQLEIDVTDIYMLDGLIHALKAQLHFFVSYELDVPAFTYTVADTAILQALLNQQDGTFLKLRTNGATNLGNTRTSLLSAITKLGLFRTFLEAETDDQTDDLIKIDPAGKDGPTAADLAEIAAGLKDLAETLSGPFEVTDTDFNGDGSVTVEDALTVDLSAYFTSPISDIKQTLPPYYWNSMDMTFLWYGWPEDFSLFVFPNPTFNGMLPDLTTDAAFKAFFGITMFPSAGPFPIG